MLATWGSFTRIASSSRAATVLDLASHDGRFSFAALQNGAARVVGIEFGADLVNKSRANMEHYKIPKDKYEFLTGDIYELIEQVEEFDVVFCFGIFYHVNSHLLLLAKIAELDPRTLIIDTNVSLMEAPVIELRGPVDGRPLELGEAVEGYPSRAAIDAMLSSFGWTYEYFDWQQSGLLEREQMLDYRAGKRLSVVVDCKRQSFSEEARRPRGPDGARHPTRSPDAVAHDHAGRGEVRDAPAGTTLLGAKGRARRGAAGRSPNADAVGRRVGPVARLS